VPPTLPDRLLWEDLQVVPRTTRYGPFLMAVLGPGRYPAVFLGLAGASLLLLLGLRGVRVVRRDAGPPPAGQPTAPAPRRAAALLIARMYSTSASRPESAADRPLFRKSMALTSGAPRFRHGREGGQKTGLDLAAMPLSALTTASDLDVS